MAVLVAGAVAASCVSGRAPPTAVLVRQGLGAIASLVSKLRRATVIAGRPAEQSYTVALAPRLSQKLQKMEQFHLFTEI
jgi:hypothetical protein